MKHILEADSIQFEINGRKLLSDIYLKLETGMVTGLLGRNGQGKTCLMNILYGTLPSEKSVRIDNVSKYEAYKQPSNMMYIPQFNFIPGFLTVEKVLDIYHGDHMELIRLAGEFDSHYNTPCRSLSGGLRRLLEIFIGINSRTRFVLLDEPFSYLSPVQIEKVKALILKAKSGKGFLITDHMYHHVIDISDKLYVLVNGKTHLISSLTDIEELGYAKLK